MNKIDAFWEIKNIEKRTVELEIDNKEISIDEKNLSEIEKNYEYVVVKVNSGNMPILRELQKKGYIFMETQISLSKKIKEETFDFDKISKNIKFDKMSYIEDIHTITNNISDNMFRTDRIALDDRFGISIANKRYRNWIEDAYNKRSNDFFIISKKEKNIGFIMTSENEDNAEILLGGIFEEYQSLGYGYNIVYQPIKYYSSKKMKFLKTKVSSNNQEVLKIYISMGYAIDNMDYIFIKHV